MFISRLKCIPQRIVLMIMVFTAMTITCSSRMALSVSITKMAPVYSKNITNVHECPSTLLNNITNSNTIQKNSNKNEFDWSEQLQGFILSAVFIGRLLFQIPSGLLANKGSAKKLMLIAVGSNCMFTFLTPICVFGTSGAYVLILFRIVIGATEAAIHPAFFKLLTAWIPVRERTRSVAFVSAGINFGSVFGASLSGYLLSEFEGWTSIFYIYGLIGLVWCLIFVIIVPVCRANILLTVCYNDPECHPFITDKEKVYIKRDIVHLSKEKAPTPWKSIVCSAQVWAIAIAQFNYSFSYFLLNTRLPKYMTTVLRFSILESGMFCALPYMVLCILNIVAGNVGDCLINRSYLARTNLRRLFGMICLFWPAIFMMAASYAECNKVVVIICFVISICTMCTFSSGVRVNCADLSPNYASIIVASTNCSGLLAAFCAPFLTSFMTPNSLILEWRQVFWLNFGIAVPSTIYFLLCCSSEVQSWNDPNKRNTEDTKL